MGRVHLQVFLLQLEAIRRDLADTVVNEQIIKPLVSLNFGAVDLPRFEFEPTPLSVFVTGQI
jgi:phage gp29-like protein